MRIKEIIVVEGKNDTNKIKQAVQADTIETNGAAIDEETIELIKHAQNKRGVIVFTDPDYPGERIRNIIQANVPNCKHAFLPQNKAQSKKQNKVGIEHASIADIRTALERVRSVYHEDETYVHDITQADLIRYGLIGSPDASKKRERLGELLAIGYTNSKQLLKRLQLFQINKEELKRAMMHILEKGE